MTATTTRAGLGAAMSLVVLVALARPGAAAERFLAPVQDRYEPGDTATMVGYVSPQDPVASGPVTSLRVAGAPADTVPLGVLLVDPGRGGSSLVRVSITFEVPPGAGPGQYEVITQPDRLVAGTLFVGMGPPQPPVRMWPPDEPEIPNLPAGAVVLSPIALPSPLPPPPPPSPSAQTVPAPPVPPATVLVQAPAPEPPSGEDDVNAALLIGGLGLAAVCTGLVLAAVRRS